MNKDIRKYIAQCDLCHREKAKVQAYPLQMTEIPEFPFEKIVIDLVMECKTSSSGNKHILTIIDHLIGWPEAFPIPDKLADTIVSTFINQYLPVHMCPRYILSDNGTEFKNQLMDNVLQQIAKKTLDENHFRTAQKTTNREAPSFIIVDRVYCKNEQSGKLDLKWRPGY